MFTRASQRSTRRSSASYQEEEGGRVDEERGGGIELRQSTNNHIAAHHQHSTTASSGARNETQTPLRSALRSSRPQDAVPPFSPQLLQSNKKGCGGGGTESIEEGLSYGGTATAADIDEAGGRKGEFSHSGFTPSSSFTDAAGLTWTDREGKVYYYYQNPLFAVCPFILLQELCERLAYYGLTPTLKPFLKKMLDIGDAQASSYIGVFQGILFLTPIVSATMADSFLGVYRTILYFSLVYAVGLGLLALSAAESIGSAWMVYLALFVFITVGAGGIKSCVNVFGAQQFHPQGQKKMITSFFTYFYASINLGSIVGGLACPQIAESVSYFVAYLIPFSSFVMATIVFFCGSKRYIKVEAQGSPVITVMKVLYRAVLCHNKNNNRNTTSSSSSSSSSASCCNFQACKKSNGGDFDDGMIDDTLQLLRLQPLCSLIVPLMLAYNQMTTAFLTQGEKMRSEIFGKRFAPALMQNVDPIAVVLASLSVEKIIFPFLRKKNCMPSIISRFAIGNFIAILALLCAYIVEREVMSQDQPETLSIWWQVPQFTLIATAEIFVISTSYEVAFTLAPHKLKAVASACNLLFFSFAGFSSGLLFVICASWLPDYKKSEPNTYQQSRYDYYYLLLAGFCVIGFLSCLAMRPYFFKYGKPPESAEEEKNSDLDSASLMEDEPGQGQQDDSKEYNDERVLLAE